MNALRQTLFAAAFLASAAADTAPGPSRRIIPLAGEPPAFFIAAADGTLKSLALPSGTRCGSAAGTGSDNPLLSPDGQKVALIQNGVLKIQSLQGKGSVTASARYPNEMFLITAWSPDSQSLIYHLSPPQGEEPQPSKIDRPQHFVYHLPSGRTWEANIRGSFQGWLSDGSMLIHDEADGSLHSQPLVKGAVSKLIAEPDLELGQISVHPSGQSIAANSNRPNTTASSQLIRLELASGVVTPLRGAGGWAEFQWPKWSPSGKRMAWLTRVSLTNGIPSSVLTIDGSPVISPRQIYEYHWLADDVLVLIESSAVFLIDGKGKTLAGYKLVRDKP